jgi:hypothetical protein
MGNESEPLKTKSGKPHLAEEFWATAMGIPVERQYLKESKYKPSAAKDPDAKYYTIRDIIDDYDLMNLTKDLKPGEKMEMNGLLPILNSKWYSENADTDKNVKFGDIDPLQRFTLQKSPDGSYVSIYDKYDFNNPALNKMMNPIEIYDRFYLPKKRKGGVIKDNRGQWAHPGKVTRIASPNITMQGVPYPVLGVGSNGQEQMMYPGQDYNFGGASYVDEYPMMKNGGGLLSKSVTCSNCGHSWKGVEGGIDPLNCHKCGGLVKMQIGGTLLQPITAQDISNFLSLFSVPQKAITKSVTGKYQTPSEAMDIKNPYGAFAVDAALDPVNLVGAGLLGKMAKASTKTGMLSNAYKYNPWAFKPNPEAGYRMIGGKEGYLDAITSGQIRPTGAYEHAHFNIGQPLNPNRLSAEELIQAGSPGGYKGPYMAEMQKGTWQRMSDAFPNNPEMQEQFRLLGKDKDVWQHPLFGNIKVGDPRLKLYKEDWLKGYKPIRLPNKKSGGQHGKQPLEKKHNIKVTYKK